MKKLVLSISALLFAALTYAQTPEFEVSDLSFTTSNDTLKPKITIKADTALPFTIALFLSEDAAFDQGDQLRLFTTAQSQKNASMVFNGSIGFKGIKIDSNIKFIIAIVTHQFEGTAENFNIGSLKADKNINNNIKIIPYSFPAAIVKEHNAPLTNTSGLTTQQAVDLITMPSYEASAFATAGTIWKATNAVVYDAEYKKNFKIISGLPVDLANVKVSVILSADDKVDANDLIIKEELVSLAKESEKVYVANGLHHITSATTDASAVNEMSDFAFWSNTKAYGEPTKSYVFVQLLFTLGDTINITKTFGFGSSSTWAYKTFVVEGVNDSASKAQFSVNYLGANSFGLASASAGQLSVYNSLGNEVFTQGILSGNNTLNLNGQVSGAYILKVETNEGLGSERVLVK